MIVEMDGHIPSALIMLTCTALPHAPLEWENNKGVHPKAAKSKLKAERPDRSNYFYHKNDGGNHASCCAGPGHTLSTLPGVADTYSFLMNTCNTLPESYQQRGYKHPLATVKRPIQQTENRTPVMVILTEASTVENEIHLDYLTSEVALVETEIRSTDLNILIDINDTDKELDLGMPGGSGDYKDDGDESDEQDAIRSPAPDDAPRPNHRGLTCTQVILMGLRARMAMMCMRMRMRRKMHRKPMMDQHRM
jgi:hypothetical protein